MRLIDGNALYEKACDLEAQALDYAVKISNDEEKREEWIRWSAILAERTAFKHDVYDAPTIEPEWKWIPCSERLPEEGQDILAYRVFGDDERIIPANYGNGCWFDCHMNCSVGHVVAWMPLPKPYGGEQDETQP